MATKTGPIRKQIGPLKSFITKHQQSAKNLLDTQGVPADPTDLDQHCQNLQLTHQNLSTAYKNLQTKHDEWVKMVQDLPDEQEHYDKSCDEIMTLLLESEELLNALDLRRNLCRAKLNQVTQSVNPGTSAQSNATSPPSSSHQSTGSTTAQQTSTSGFKAPKIKLPSFSGSYVEFKQFWGIFEANIHNRSDLTNVEKFTYLITQLEGDARLAVAGVLVNDDNYEVAVSLLKSRYDRADDRLITMLYSEFMQVPVSTRKVEDKQRTLDECEKIFRQLESAGENINSNKSLVFGLLTKFPASVVRDLQRYYNAGPNNTLKEIRDGLRKSIMEEEAMTGIVSDLNVSVTRQGKDNRKSPYSNKPSADDNHETQTSDRRTSTEYNNTALATVTQYQSNRSGAQMTTPPRGCYFCSDDHFNGDCPKYASAAERKQRLVELKRCTRCLFLHKRPSSACTNAIKCVHCRIANSHSSALCPRKYPTPANTTTMVTNVATHRSYEPNSFSPTVVDSQPSHASSQPTNVNSSDVTALNHSSVKPTLFQTAKTFAVNTKTGQRCQVRLAMDTLSSRSYIRDTTASKLGFSSDKTDKIYVSVFGASGTMEVPTSRVEFDITLRDGSRRKIEVNTTRVICQNGVTLNEWSEKERQILDRFHDSLADDPYDNDGTIDVLIGSSLVWDFIEGPKIQISNSGLFLIPSKLGLLLGGQTQGDASKSESAMLCITDSHCQFPNELGLVSCESKFEGKYPDVDEFWKLENIGISDDPIENEDFKALERFEETVTFKDGRYQVAFPWIEEKKAVLPTNYEEAYDRLRYLSKRLKANPDLAESYRNILAFQLGRDVIEEVPTHEIECDNAVHYLPHHPVLRPSSNTTKIRLVFDASFKKNRQCPSLNECLLRGPVILPDLCQLLMRIRTYATIIISDIEKAFLQVELQPRDRDVTRFLWLADDTNPNLKDNVKVFRSKRVNFGLVCSPFLLAATIQHHLTREGTEFAESLRDDIYVDNVISGFNNDKDPIEYYHALKGLFKRAGMNIQEFNSNSPVVMQLIPEKDWMRGDEAKVLGLKWASRTDDTLRLTLMNKFHNVDSKTTKRTVLRTVASIFDPLGFFQPIMLPAKRFLQRLWEFKYDWDAPLDSKLQSEWTTLKASLSQLHSHRIPRFIGTIDDNTTISVFCDASSRAYATTVYLRCRQGNAWKCRFIFAKSRLAPSAKKNDRKEKHITLPRLELLGVVIGVRAGIFCRNGLKAEAKLDIFTDSQCVLHWIDSQKPLKRFVTNRIEEIRRTKNCEFHYVATSENPADFGTRGKLPSELFTCDLWWNGPPWLEKEQGEWPNTVPSISDELLRQIQEEFRPAHSLYALVTAEVFEMPYLLTIDPKNFSSLQKLFRVTEICFTFIKLRVWDKLPQTTKDSKPKLRSLFDGSSGNESYDVVKREWIKSVQRRHYSEAIDSLHPGGTGRPEPPPQIVSQLGLYLDENEIIRCRGRFEHAELPPNARIPALLPKDERVTALIVEDIHQRTMHCGVSHTLSQIRQEFWIPKGRALVRTTLKRCLICRHYKTATPFKLPLMPPWPKERVSRSTPFLATGLDYFGPVTVKVNEEKHKMWVCLFTCLSTRAIHLEPVMDFSAQEFLHCLIRFVSRRAIPEKIISDNAAQFRLVKILGDKAFSEIPPDNTTKDYLKSNSIKWQFITELAPWQGGFYERMVGIVKSALRTTIRRRFLTWTDFITLLTEAEAIVNSRPLTYVGDDIESQFRTIRPCDFLIGQKDTATTNTLSSSNNDIRTKDFGEAGKRLVSIWKQRCRVLDHLWKIWLEDYLLSLRELRKVSHKSGRSDTNRQPKLHEIVLISDPDIPRGRWRLAEITKLITGTDGQVRTAEVRLANGIRTRRALNFLVPLEIEQSYPSSENLDGAVQNPHQTAESNCRDSRHRNESYNNDEESFLGFSSDDIQRTIDALQRIDQTAACVIEAPRNEA